MQKTLKFFLVMIFTTLGVSNGQASTADYEAVIFDVDGVLADTEKLKYEAWRDALQEQNIDFTVEEYYPLVGLSSKDILEGIEALKNQKISNDVIKIKDSYYHAKQKKGVPLLKAGVSFLKDMIGSKRERGIKVALASSAPMHEILENVSQMGLEEADFDCIASGKDSLQHIQDSEGVNKPKPYIYQYVSKKLGVDAKKCIVFEDTNAGVVAAADAGMDVYSVPNAFTKDQDFSRAQSVTRFDNLKIDDVLQRKE